jgi:hypothetical protein
MGQTSLEGLMPVISVLLLWVPHLGTSQFKAPGRPKSASDALRLQSHPFVYSEHDCFGLQSDIQIDNRYVV